MNNLINAIKLMIKNFFEQKSAAIDVGDLASYRKAKSWLKKAITLYSFFSVMGIVVTGLVIKLVTAVQGFHPIVIILPILLLLTFWGYATLIMYLPEIIKNTLKAGKAGFEVGQNVETTHVDVEHVYGNTYKVSSHTENKGCLFAFIAGGAKLFVWLFFCVYIGPFLTLKKAKGTSKNIKEYEAIER